MNWFSYMLAPKFVMPMKYGSFKKLEIAQGMQAGVLVNESTMKVHYAQGQ